MRYQYRFRAVVGELISLEGVAGESDPRDGTGGHQMKKGAKGESREG